MKSLKFLGLIFIYSVSFGANATVSDLSFEELQAIAKKSGSVRGFLEELSPQFGHNWVAVYKSLSLHRRETSPETPRFIFFSKSGKTLVAAVPNSDTQMGQTVEVLQFDDKTLSYSSATVNFSGTARKLEVNPNSCVQCHGTSLRPNWEPWHPYYSWPGVFGSNDDRLYKNSEELRHWENYSKSNPDFLKAIGVPSSPLEKGSDPTMGDYVRLPRLEPELPSYALGVTDPGLRNQSLTGLLEYLNRQRVRGILRKWNHIGNYLPALAGIAQGCELKGFLSDNAKKLRVDFYAVEKETFEIAQARAYRHLQQLSASEALMDAIGSIWKSWNPEFMGVEIESLGELAEEPSAVMIEDLIAKRGPEYLALVQQLRRENLPNGPLNIISLSNILNYQTVTFKENVAMRWLLAPYAKELHLSEWSLSRGLRFFAFGDMSLISPIVMDLERDLGVQLPQNCDELGHLSRQKL